jgi:DNA-binding protein Fis
MPATATRSTETAARVWSKAEVIGLVARNDKAVERALATLFDRQTPTEQETESTGIHNGVGFNAVDAPLLSSFAKQIARSNRVEGQRLSPVQREWARKKLRKYGAQLTRIANGEG